MKTVKHLFILLMVCVSSISMAQRTASISILTPQLCKGETATVAIRIVGTEPFEISYSLNNVSTVLSGITYAQMSNGQYLYSWTPNVSQSFILEQVKDALGNIVIAGNNAPWINVYNPSISFNLSVGDNPSCSGSTVFYKTNYTPCTKYSWESSEDGITYTPNGSTSDVGSFTFSNTGSSTKNYYIRMKVGGTGQEIYSAPLIHKVLPALQTGTVQANKSIFCSGENFTLSSTGHQGQVRWETFRWGSWVLFGYGNNLSSLATGFGETQTYRAVYYYDFPACPLVYSSEINIQVNQAISSSVLSSAGFSSCNGIPLILSVNTYRGGQVQWEQSIDGINFTDIVGANSLSSSVTFYNSTNVVNNVYIRLKSSQPGCGSLYSNVVPCRVNPDMVSGIISSNKSNVCSGQQFTLTSSGHTGSVNWEWYFGGMWNQFGTGTSLTTTLYHNPQNPNNLYRATYTSDCGQATSNEITITSYPVLFPAYINNTLTVCNNEAFSTAALGYSTGGEFQWEESLDGLIFTPILNATSSTLTHTLLNSGNTDKEVYLRLKSSSLGCGSLISNVMTCTVKPAPSIGTASTTNSEVCSGQYSNLALTNAVGNTQWFYSSDNINFNQMYPGTGLNVSTGYLYSNSNMETRFYRAISSYPGCASTAVSNTVSLNVYKNLYGSGYTSSMYNIKICHGSSQLLQALPVIGATYQWYENINGTLSLIPGATNYTYQTPVLLNPGNSILYKYYVLYINNGACTQSNGTLTVQVNPIPTAGTISSLKTEICKDQYTTLSISGNSTSPVSWFYSTDGGNVFTYFGGNQSILTNYITLTNQNFIDVQYRASVTDNICAPVLSNTITIRNYNVSPEFKLNEPWPQAISVCGKTNGELIRLKSYPQLFGNFIWQQSINNVFVDIPGSENQTTFTIPPYTNTSGVTQILSFRAKLTNGNVCTPLYSEIYKVNVSKELEIGNLTVSPNEICRFGDVLARLDNHNGIVYWYMNGGSTNIPSAGLTKTFTIYNDNSPANTVKLYAEVAIPASEDAFPTFPCRLRSNVVPVIAYNTPQIGSPSFSYSPCNTIRDKNSITINLNGAIIGDRFEWSVQLPGTTGFVPYKNTTTPSLTTDPLDYINVADPTYQFKVRAYNGVCSTSVLATVTALVKVLPVSEEIIVPTVLCNNQSSFILKIKNYGQTSVGLQKLVGSTYQNLGLGFTLIAGYHTLSVPISATTTYRLVSYYGGQPCNNINNDFTVIMENALSTSLSINGNAHICPDNTVANYSVVAQAGSIYEWSVSPLAAGTFTNNAENMAFTHAAGYIGTATIACKISNSCGAVTITKIIEMHPYPNLSFVGLPSDVCFSSTSITLVPNISGAIIGGDNVIDNNFYPNTLGSLAPTLFYTDPITTCSTMYAQLVEVHPLPTVDAGPDKVVCQGTPMILSATGSGAVSYTWDKGVVNNAPFTPSSTIYTVTAHSAYGCTATDDMSVLVNPIPLFNAIPNTTICSGTTLSIPISSSNVPTATFSWTSASAGGSISGNSSGSGSTISDILTNTGNTGVVKYVITGTSNNCSGSTSFDVTVNPNPVITSILSKADPCPMEPFTYTLLKQSGFTYSPLGGSLSASTTVDNLSPTQLKFNIRPFMTSGDISITLTNNITNCSSTDTKIISVKPLPIINATPLTVCAGSAFDIPISSNDPLATYFWSLANTSSTLSGLMSSGNGSHITGTPEGSGTATYYIYSVGSNACSSFAPISVDLTVNPNPLHSVGISSSTVCEGGNVSISIGTPIDPPGFSYTFTEPAGFTYVGSGGSQLGYGVGWKAGSTGGNFVVTSNNPNTHCGRVSVYPITVNPLPAAPVVTVNPVGCNGQIGVFQMNNISGINYSWTLPIGSAVPGASCGNNGTTTGCNFYYTGSGGNLIVTATNTFSCSTSTTTVITVKPSPTITVSSPALLCSGNTNNINISSTLPGTSFSWTAVAQSGTPTGFSDGTGNSIQQTLGGIGTVAYTIVGSNSNGCNSPSTLVNQQVANYPVSVTVTASPPSVTKPADGGKVIFTANVVNGGSNPSYQWKVNNINRGTNSPTFNRPNLVVAARSVPGDQVKCVVTSNKTCAVNNPATSNTVVIFCSVCREDDLVSEKEEEPANAAAYPNPFTESINVYIPKPIEEKVELIITNLNGVEVERLFTTENQVTLGSHLTSGIYILKVVSNTGIQTFKISKLH